MRTWLARLADSIVRSEWPLFSDAHLDAHEPYPGHLQELQPVAEALDICFTISPRQIPYRNVDDFEAELGRGKEQFEVAERIELAEVFSPGHHALVIVPGDKLRAAQRIAETYIQDGAQHFCKENISHAVQGSHRRAFHRIDQPRPVDEIAVPLVVCKGKSRKHFRWHGKIRGQNNETVFSF